MISSVSARVPFRPGAPRRERLLIAFAMRCLGAAASLALLGAVLPASADPALPDPGFFNHDEDPVPLPGERAPKHLYIFGTPYTWPGTVSWRYNDAGRPAVLAKQDVISGINSAAGQWMAACNVRIAQDPGSPDTSAPPQSVNGTMPSPNQNVIGWGDLTLPPNGGTNLSGITFTSSLQGKLVDADTTFSTRWVNNVTTLQRVALHEFGHALGLAHSNVEAQVMSGPGGPNNPGVPATQYDGVTTLQADDIQGCLCLYGPSAANQGRGYLCDLPTVRDFGSVPLGTNSAAQTVTLRNAATSGYAILGAISFSSPDFRYAGGCYPGTTLAPGASCSFGIVFTPVGVAGPRQAYAQIDTGSLGPYKFPVTGTATGEPPRNYQGLWWNSPAGSESGWGINFEHQGDIIFATWFTYDADGKPWWLVSQARKTGPGVYSGPISTVTGPSFDSVPFDPSQVAKTVVGWAALTFADGDHASFAYDIGGKVQTKPITRQVFGDPFPSCAWGLQTDLTLATNYQGLWWNAPAGSESGWGINFSHQGDVIFATWFTFGADGKPWWLVAQTRKTAQGVYTGNVSSVTGPPYDSVPWDAARVVRTVVGATTLTFDDGNNATFAYDVNGVAQVKTISRQVFAAPGTVCQ